MEIAMAGTAVSFIADPTLATRLKEIARSDGVTQSQAAARVAALGALLPPAARRTLRFVLAEGGEEAREQLAAAVAKAIAQVGNVVIERQLLARAPALAAGSDRESEEELADRASRAVGDIRRLRGDGWLTETTHEKPSNA
jgi:hypothetical protein